MNINVKFLKPSKTNQQVINRLKRYGSFDSYFCYKGKMLTFSKLKKLIESKKKILINNPKNPNYIKCELSYNDRWDNVIPIVKESNHPRFTAGTRFDYGFMFVSLRDGYSLFYNY